MLRLCCAFAVLVLSNVDVTGAGLCQYRVEGSNRSSVDYLISCPDECSCLPKNNASDPKKVGCGDCDFKCPNDSFLPFWSWFIIIPVLIALFFIAIIIFCCVLKNTFNSCLG